MIMKANVRAILVDGLIKPADPLNLPNGTELELDIRVTSPVDATERSAKVQRLAEALQNASFASGEPTFRRDDLYDRD